MEKTTNMTDDQLMEYLSSDYWQVNKPLVRKLGISAALWISHILYKHRYFKKHNMLDKEGYFYNTQDDIKRETSIGSSQQNRIIKILNGKGILKIKRYGLPAKNYYKINPGNLIKSIAESSSPKIKELDPPKSDIRLNNKEDLINKESSLSSLRKEDKESKSGICYQTSDSVNSSPRPSLDTASKDVLATVDSESLEKEDNESLIKADLPAKSSRPTRDDSILPRKKLPANQLEYEHASDEARSLVEDWNELTTTPTHKKESKIVRRVLHLLDEKLLKEHTPKEIYRAMLDFSTMQKDAGNYRVPAGKVNIDDFFIGNGYLNGARERRGETVEPPWFQRLVLPGSFAKYLRREDPDPDVTEEFKHRYRRHILADQGVSFTPRQESQFREASKRLREFMKKGRLEKFLDNVSYGDYIRWLLEALIGKYKKVTEIEVGHLCSEYTWNDLFPKFIAYNWEE